MQTNRTRYWMRHSAGGALAAALAIGGLTDTTSAGWPKVEFDELAHTADVIFVGAVADTTTRVGATGRMVFTDVRFDPVEIIARKPGVALDPDGSLTLSFAGGSTDERTMVVSHAPHFEVADRYLLFALHDGRQYVNPLVGGPQGLFQLADDLATGAEVPLAAGRLGVDDVIGGRLITAGPVDVVIGGIAHPAPSPIRFEAAPQPADNLAGATRSRDVGRPRPVLTLDEFVVRIEATLATPPPAERALRGLRFDDPVIGGAPTPALDASSRRRRPLGDGDAPIAPVFDHDEPLETGRVAPLDRTDSAAAPTNGPPSSDAAHGSQCWCGYHDLFLTMQQVPDTWWSWDHNNDAMWQFNQFMDIYRYIDSDGTFGWTNGTNEFAGWPSDSSLNDVYGFNWGGALAYTFTHFVGGFCTEIDESDVAFNPAYSWWEELEDTLGQSGRWLYRTSLMHELGHTLAMEVGSGSDGCGTENYVFGFPSIMHGGYTSIVEDGWGLHSLDALIVRSIYDDQTGVIGRQDMGIESYYSTGFLSNATTSGSVFEVGDTITVQNLTVENMSSSTTSNVRVRFWLSTNDIISTGDYQMGSYWSWDTFSAEAWWSGNLTTTVPSVPPGEYYVGLMVTVGGDSYLMDDLVFNNATYLASTITVTEPPPTNDPCFGAFAIGTGTIPFTTIGATTDGSAHASCQFDGQTYHDVWFEYFATSSGTLTVTTCEDLGGAADYDTDLVVYEGCGCGGLVLLACNDDDPLNACGAFPDYHSTVQVEVDAGTCYKIRVGGYNPFDVGTGLLNVAFAAGCTSDLDGDGVVGFSDVVALLSDWGTPDGDVNGDGTTGFADLVVVLSDWGACP